MKVERITVDDMKKIQLDILQSFVNYCEKNKLEYFLAAGTAIGAVRHRGFIPWDDDIDVMMPRNSYNKFLAEYINENYEVFDCWRREDYYYPFAKLVDKHTLLKEKTKVPTSFGVYIDIFPIDVIPDSKVGMLLLKLKRNLIDFKITTKVTINRNRSKWKKICLWLGRLFFKKERLIDCVREMDSLYKKYADKSSLYMYCISFFFMSRKPMLKEIYSDYILCSFEGIQCRLPVGNDILLKSIYGDYMKLPPMEKRIYKHDVEAFKIV